MAPLFDVVIVGGGMAGIAAGLRAQEQGAHAAIVERGQQVGGAGSVRLSGGVFHLGGVPIDLEPEVALAHVTKMTEGQIPAPLAKMVAERAKWSIEWLEKQGIAFAPAGSAMGKFTINPRGPSSNGRRFNTKASPDKAMRELHLRFINQGGTIYYGARAQKLARGTSDTWTVETSSPETEGLRVEGTCVVIADGGFQADAKLIDRYLGPKASKAALRAMDTGTGDGLRMAQSVGAVVAGEGHGVYGHVLYREAAQDDRYLPYPMFDGLAANAPMVDERGQLFEHGSSDGPEITAKMLSSRDPSAYSVILDEALWKGPAAGGGPYHPSINPGIEQKGGKVDKGETLEALAKASGMDSTTFKASVERHNGKGKAKIGQGPFYRVPVVAGITFTMPGIAIDEKGRILDGKREPILGLYAAGSSTGGIQGKAGGGGYIGGLAIALITGILAGESAATKAKN